MHARKLSLRLAASLLAASLALPGAVGADREHRVREGQTLAAIARRYDVSIGELARANNIRPNGTIRVGQVLIIPTAPAITVSRGQTLRSIARDNGVTIEALARANNIRPTAHLREGQSLIVPGVASSTSAGAVSAQWGRPRQPGMLQLSRLGSRERVKLRLVDARGRIRSSARAQLENIMRNGNGTTRPPNPRLMQQLTRISDYFGGRRIIVVSGYRPAGGYTRETSRHTQGDALDIRIEGVPITAIRDYCRSLPSMGCGYYPRSQFVHVDVRDRATYWIDYSGPGEAPRYSRNGSDESGGDEGSDATAGAAEGGESGVGAE